MSENPKPDPAGETDGQTASQTPDEKTETGKTVAEETVAEETVDEVGGRGGLDPSRYGDWEKNGRCIDF